MICTQTRPMMLRTCTAPVVHTGAMTFLFRPAARSISVQQGGLPREVILQPQSVPVVPKVEPVEEEVVKGLREWLEKTGLLHLKAGIEAWAEEPAAVSEEGAAFLEEVTGNAADIAKALQLNKEESSRFQAKLKGLPPPLAEARVRKQPKKLPIAPSPCPGCHQEDRMLWNVTIASQHEGWGRKWNECNYACQLCRRHISRDLHVNACRDCKVMWHGDCQQALAMDQAKKRVVPAPAVAVPTAPKLVQKAQPSLPLRTVTVPVPVGPGQQQIAAPVSIFDRHMSTPFTTEEMNMAAKHVATAYVPLQAWNFAKIPVKRKIEAPLTPNEVLIEDIDPLPGQMDRRIILETQGKLRDFMKHGPVPEEQCRGLLRRRIPNTWELRHPMEEEMKEEEAGCVELFSPLWEDKEFRRDDLNAKPGQKGFQGVQERIMQNPGYRWSRRYQSFGLGEFVKEKGSEGFKSLKLEKAEVAKPVQQKFMEAMDSGYPIIPTFHGSNAQHRGSNGAGDALRNYSSILQRGLLIPGRNNELRVVNGSVHGKGIYTARLSNPQLSAGFCTDPKLLVCGVLDDAAGSADSIWLLEVPVERSNGHFQVHAQSNAVKHVGDAVVVFDESRVVPLFQASAQTFSRPHWGRAPNPNKAASATGWLGNWAPPSPSQIAYMPPTPDTYRHNIEQKRIYEKKARDLRMKHRREEKMEQMHPDA
eukprot:s376_g27.t1